MAPEGRLSAAEWDQLRSLMRRYISHELDQWEHWCVETPYGPAYVTLTNAMPPDVPPELFHKV